MLWARVRKRAPAWEYKVILLNDKICELLSLSLGDSKILDFISFIGEKFVIDEVDDDVYFSFENSWLEILFSKRKITAFFFNLEKRKYNKMNIKIFNNFENLEKIDDVIEFLKCKVIDFGGGANSIIGFIDPWIKFKLKGNIYVNIQYDIDSRFIKLITVSVDNKLEKQLGAVGELKFHLNSTRQETRAIVGEMKVEELNEEICG